MLSITYGSLATITSAAMGYVPAEWPGGWHLPGGLSLSAGNASSALFFATAILALLSINAARREKNVPPPEDPPVAPPAASSGDQPRPLSKLWAFGAAPLGLSASRWQPTALQWEIAGAFLCLLFAGGTAYLAYARWRRTNKLSEAALD
jgi:hypothetical protein